MNDTRRHDDHIPPSMMKDYVLGQLNGHEREQVDAHLMACDACLQLFITTEPALDPQVRHPDLPRLESQVISRLRRAYRRRRRPRWRWLQRSSVQYTIAASITLVLYFSGTFSGIATTLMELERHEALKHEESMLLSPSAADQRRESWSEQMVSRTGSWLDSLKSARFDQVKKGEAGRYHE